MLAAVVRRHAAIARPSLLLKVTTMDPGLQKIVNFLGRECTRATYGAVGEALNVPERAVASMLGPRRHEASWIVSAETGEPTGYEAQEMHPAFHEKAEIITTGLELLRRIVGIEPRGRAG
jgi:hypothetical protein